MLDRAADTPGHALTHRYNEKMAKHGAACSGVGLAFIPMPVETLGGWHDQSVLQVKKIGSALARHTGQEDSVTINHLFQRLSVLLAKGNAALLLNRIPEVNFYRLCLAELQKNYLCSSLVEIKKLELAGF